ncbi:SEC-C metal-binding domain-containing protein [Janthinobacterium sp. 64]|uniref:SEC-C metal-binding domain-containing protein n=1 Tax=Janthinobacterium sp. 64 TaxID=2035208 RepID=UPI000CAA3BFA|nr:SEC-C metal-binding domain-containing protein [Janthinobacterium sp. 64]PKB13819.1 SEC-C motif-containing protein [Janthinobacterium sp. 64]
MVSAPTLAPAQEIRIEAVHRGFLYQHLYAAACLLNSEQTGAISVAVERDEDIEQVTSAGRTYIQVKTRGQAIMPADIKSALERFDALRQEHAQGRRPGRATFVVVVNRALGPTLADQVRTGQLAGDVEVLYPGRVCTGPLAQLPPAWSGIDEAVSWCVDRATTVPLAMLAPDSLVWKLAGRVQAAAAGEAPHADHTFEITDLPSLFDQIIIQLQDFPAPPEQYRPQENEPQIDSNSRVRILSGFSGAGKTAWASQAATFSSHNCAYFDCSETPGEALALSLVRELAAKLAGAGSDAVRKILLPGATGVESLRQLDIYLKSSGLSPIVVLDNVHRISAESIKRMVDVTSALRFMLLAQPLGTLPEIEALLGLRREPLNGWGVDTVAAAAVEWECRGDAATMGRLKTLTGGLPLFVRSAATIAREDYDGRIDQMCNAVDALTNLTQTAQEVILAKVFDAFPLAARQMIAVLSLSDIGLLPAEANKLLEAALGMDVQAVAGVIRTLRAAGVVEVYGNKEIRLHDAIRVVGSQHLSGMPAGVASLARNSLKELMVESFERSRTTARFSQYTRLLLASGDVKTLVELIREEMFHEMGVAAEIWHGLEGLVAKDASDPEQQYWALDGLAFSDMKLGHMDRVARRLDAMGRLIDSGALGEEEILSFLMKRMLLLSHLGDENGVQRTISDLDSRLPDKPVYRRVFLYNAAAAFYDLGDYKKAMRVLEQVIDDTFAALGIRRDQVFRAKNAELWALINKPGLDQGDIKRLADALEFKAIVAGKLHVLAPFERIHAMKFYAIAGAIDSLIRVGQDLADEFIVRQDFVTAREVLEQHVMPVVVGNQLLNRHLDVRAQYAVVLAYCGLYSEAEREMERLQVYAAGLAPQARLVLMRQRELVAEIKANPIPQRRQGGRNPAIQKSTPISSGVKIGRNDPCSCGSGKKFKKCGCGLVG